MIELLVLRGADVNAKEYKYGDIPLHLATLKGDLKIVEFLILHGADAVSYTHLTLPTN